jgi:hypothetical protein
MSNKFIHTIDNNKVLYRAAKSEKNLPINTFFALSKAGAGQYAKNGRQIYEFKPQQPLKLFKLNKNSLDFLRDKYPYIEKARKYAYPTIKDTRNRNKLVMGRFSEYNNDTLKAERTVMGAIKKLGLDGYIITKGVPVATMGNNKRAVNNYTKFPNLNGPSVIFKPEVAIFGAANKVKPAAPARRKSVKPSSPGTPRTPPGTPRTPNTPRTPVMPAGPTKRKR